MLHHVVLFELDPDATDDAVDAAVAGLAALHDAVEGIVSLTVGRDAGLVDGNAGLALVLVAEDEQVWREYQACDAHVRVVTELVRPVITGRTAAQLVS